MHQVSDVAVADLPAFDATRVSNGIQVDDLAAAEAAVQELAQEAAP